MKLTIILVLLNITFSMYGNFSLQFYCPDSDPSNIWKDETLHKEILASRWHETSLESNNSFFGLFRIKLATIELSNHINGFGSGRLYIHYYELRKQAIGSYMTAKLGFFKNCIDLNDDIRDLVENNNKINEEKWKRQMETIVKRIQSDITKIQLSNEEIIKRLSLPQTESTKNQIKCLRESIEIINNEISVLRGEINVLEKNRYQYGL